MLPVTDCVRAANLLKENAFAQHITFIYYQYLIVSWSVCWKAKALQYALQAVSQSSKFSHVCDKHLHVVFRVSKHLIVVCTMLFTDH